MQHPIFVNLKRFDVPRDKGGVCPMGDPVAWIESVVDGTIRLGLGRSGRIHLTYLLPEGLVAPAIRKLRSYPEEARAALSIGVQGVHWDDVRPGKNFGAFTTSVPAAAAVNLGCDWAIVGHSEERRAKYQVMHAFEPAVESNDALRIRANRAIDRIVQSEVQCARTAGLNVLLCIGETAEERGSGDLDQQRPRIEAVLKAQLLTSLGDAVENIEAGSLVIGYEPVWAIGPGKTPPDREYIAFVSKTILDILHDNLGIDAPVVYGGGLKEENAAMLASIETISGGLVALTRFTGEIGFDVQGLKGILDKYLV